MDFIEQEIPRTVALMRELMGIVRAEGEAESTQVADEAQFEYRADGVSAPLVMLCEYIIEHEVALPRSVVDRYREVGETEQADDRYFMHDYYEDLKALVA